MTNERVRSAGKVLALLRAVASREARGGYDRVMALRVLAETLADGAYVPVMDSARWAAMVDPDALRESADEGGLGQQSTYELACAVRVALAYDDLSGLAGCGYTRRVLP